MWRKPRDTTDNPIGELRPRNCIAAGWLAEIKIWTTSYFDKTKLVTYEYLPLAALVGRYSGEAPSITKFVFCETFWSKAADFGNLWTTSVVLALVLEVGYFRAIFKNSRRHTVLEVEISSDPEQNKLCETQLQGRLGDHSEIEQQRHCHHKKTFGSIPTQKSIISRTIFNSRPSHSDCNLTKNNARSKRPIC